MMMMNTMIKSMENTSVIMKVAVAHKATRSTLGPKHPPISSKNSSSGGKAAGGWRWPLNSC